ncbi:MAG: hypothetical protein UGF86_08105 [Bifidobacterium longum]|nr:hypothetical protein [Bifidobacterium longum]
MSTLRNANTLEFFFPSVESDYPDGIHPNYGFMNVNASWARILNDRSDAARTEELERIRQILAIDKLGKRLGFAGMDADRVRGVQSAFDRIMQGARDEH